MPAETSVIIFAPYSHREEERLPEAHLFAPDLWPVNRSAEQLPLVPFSGGTAICPGRNLVLLLASAMLAKVLDQHAYRLDQPERLNPDKPLPGTLDHSSLGLIPEA